MKKVAFLVAVLMLVFSLSSCASATNFLGQYEEQYNTVKELSWAFDYSGILAKLEEYQETNPEMFTPSLYADLEADAKWGAELMDGISSQYDKFEDSYTFWVEDRQEPTLDNNAVAVIGLDGVSSLLMMIPVEKQIKVEDYTAIFETEDGEDRIESYVENRASDKVDGTRVETFSVYLPELPLGMTSLSFRFYGKDGEADYEVTDAQLADLNHVNELYAASDAMYHALGDDWYRHLCDLVKQQNPG